MYKFHSIFLLQTERNTCTYMSYNLLKTDVMTHLFKPRVQEPVHPVFTKRDSHAVFEHGGLVDPLSLYKSLGLPVMAWSDSHNPLSVGNHTVPRPDVRTLKLGDTGKYLKMNV